MSEGLLHPVVELTAEIEALKKQKDGAYAERNQCVALIARMAHRMSWVVGVGQHPAEDTAWEDDWRTILFVTLPWGQMSWHFHDSEKHLLEGLPVRPDIKWDGHTTEEKYRRLNAAFRGW